MQPGTIKTNKSITKIKTPPILIGVDFTPTVDELLPFDLNAILIDEEPAFIFK